MSYRLAGGGTALAATLAAFLLIDSLFYGVGSWQRHDRAISDFPWQIWLWLSALFTAYIGAIVGSLGAITDEIAVKFGSIIFCIANIFLLGVAATDDTLSGMLLVALGWPN